ncbi:MAG: hypothetical protein AVDCRST_MAG31-231, partial [uncultured Sphingomonas sp.]
GHRGRLSRRTQAGSRGEDRARVRGRFRGRGRQADAGKRRGRRWLRRRSRRGDVPRRARRAAGNGHREGGRARPCSRGAAADPAASRRRGM